MILLTISIPQHQDSPSMRRRVRGIMMSGKMKKMPKNKILENSGILTIVIYKFSGISIFRDFVFSEILFFLDFGFRDFVPVYPFTIFLSNLFIAKICFKENNFRWILGWI